MSVLGSLCIQVISIFSTDKTKCTVYIQNKSGHKIMLILMLKIIMDFVIKLLFFSKIRLKDLQIIL